MRSLANRFFVMRDISRRHVMLRRIMRIGADAIPIKSVIESSQRRWINMWRFPGNGRDRQRTEQR